MSEPRSLAAGILLVVSGLSAAWLGWGDYPVGLDLARHARLTVAPASDTSPDRAAARVRAVLHDLGLDADVRADDGELEVSLADAGQAEVDALTSRLAVQLELLAVREVWAEAGDRVALDAELGSRGPAPSGARILTEAGPGLHRALLVEGRPLLTGADVGRVDLSDPAGALLTLEPASAERFAAFTAAHAGEAIAIVIDDEVVAAPVVSEPITDGRLMVGWGPSADPTSASRLSGRIASAAGPRLTVVHQSVGGSARVAWLGGPLWAGLAWSATGLWGVARATGSRSAAAAAALTTPPLALALSTLGSSTLTLPLAMGASMGSVPAACVVLLSVQRPVGSSRLAASWPGWLLLGLLGVGAVGGVLAIASAAEPIHPSRTLLGYPLWGLLVGGTRGALYASFAAAAVGGLGMWVHPRTSPRSR